MALRSRRGFGATCAAQQASIFSSELWGYILHGCPDISVAPPKAPTGSVLTTPPASGDDAQATVDALLNQQMRDQQALDASKVKSTWLDSLASGVVDTGNSLNPFSGDGVPTWVWVAGAGLVVFALVAVGGAPRRYGR